MWPVSIGNILSTISLILSITSAFIFYKAYSVLKMLKNVETQRSINDILSGMDNHLKESKLSLNELQKTVEDHQRLSLNHFQKAGFIRFNPFTNTGGDQSFTLAILNGHNDGFVISSLHSRDQTRTFAKPIKAGQGEKFELSKEEKLAIDRAIKGL
ncbi:DUF4446 family protein [Candidatus Collierbacteria bacterium]|nr:DUF4446 family protein [Candidatus Collierbacteria bacterium]